MRRLVAVLCAFLILFSSVAPAYAAPGSTTVYITNTGECYHTGSCSYLRQSKISTTLESAVARGYRPCSRCNPPRLDSSSSASSRSASDQAEPARSGPSAVVIVGAAAAAGSVGYFLGKKRRR